MVDPNSQTAEYLRRLESRVANTEGELRGDSIPRQIGQFDEEVGVSSSVATSVAQATPGNLNPDFVLDDFEDNDLSEWTFDGGGSNISIVTSPVWDGSYGVEFADPADMFSRQGDGLPNYPEKGDTFAQFARVDGSDDRSRIQFGTAPDNYDRIFGDGAWVELRWEDNRVDLAWIPDGGVVDNQSVTFDVGDWYQVNIKWGTTTVEAEVINKTDSTLDASLSYSYSNDLGGNTIGLAYGGFNANGQFDAPDFGTI